MRITRIPFTLIIILLLVSGCGQQQSQPLQPEKPPLDTSKLNMAIESQLAMQKAVKVYQQAIADKVDLTDGPCLSNELFGNKDYPETLWVLDIAHNPREEIDDLPENQCSAFSEGKAENFIELDPDGNLIKLYSPLLNQQNSK